MSTEDSLPIKGVIESYLPADGVGRVRTADGEEVRFGGTACKGFEPEVNLEVYVVEVGPHPLGGLRAKVLRLMALTDEEIVEKENARCQAEEAQEAQRLTTLHAPLHALVGEQPGTPSFRDIEGMLDPSERDLLRALSECRFEEPGWELEDEHLNRHTGWWEVLSEPDLSNFHPDPAHWCFAGNGDRQWYFFFHPRLFAETKRLPVLFWEPAAGERPSFQAENLHTFVQASFFRRITRLKAMAESREDDVFPPRCGSGPRTLFRAGPTAGYTPRRPGRTASTSTGYPKRVAAASGSRC